MGKYYTDEFQKIDAELSDIDSFAIYKDTLSDSVTEVCDLAQIVVDQMSDLAGDSVDELDSTLQDYINGFKDKKEYFNTKLEGVYSTCQTLIGEFQELKSGEEEIENSCLYNDSAGDYEIWHGESQEEKDMFTQEDLEYFQAEYARLQAIEENLKVVFESATTHVKEIDDFNLEIEGFSLSTLTLSLALDSDQELDIERMSADEKKALLASAIEKYNNLYNENKKNLLSNQQDGLVSVLNALGYPYGLSMDGPFNYQSFKTLYTFINTKVVGDKTPIDVINDYFNGQDWEESGMASLAMALGEDHGYMVKDATDVDYEAEFWNNMLFQIDGRGTSNSYTPFFMMSTDYYKEYGGDVSDVYNSLFIDKLIDPDDPNYEYYTSEKYGNAQYTTGRQKYLNIALIKSLKSEFVNEGYLQGLNDYVAEINRINDEYGEALPLIEALDGRMDWTDNNSVIPKEVIVDYLNGKSWEDSGLSRYSSKTEEQFLLDYMDLYGTEYSMGQFTTDKAGAEGLRDYEAWKAQMQEEYGLSEQYTGNFAVHSEKTTSLFPSTDGVDAVSTNYSKESIKALMKSRGVADQVGSYYDNVNARNNQIEEETTTQYAIATSIRQLESDLAELSPKEMSPQDILREQNKAAGEQLAKSYLDAIDGISGKNEHIHTYTQDEYVAIKQAENPALTREEILKDYVSGWKDAYKTELINEKNYNPECARIAAEKQSYNDKTVTVDDANGVSKVIYFVRDVGADAVTATAGLTSGTIDLGRNLKHVVAPDLVPTPLEYAEDAIAREYNDPNSQYYDPVKGAIYSTTRTIGHDAPIQVLKAIPQTKAIGETLDFLDKYGKKVNTNYQNNGGNFGAAHVKAAGDTAIDMAADAMTNSIPGASGFEKIASTAVGETFRDLGHNFLNTGDLEEAAQQTFNNAGKIFRTVATKNMPGDVSITGNKAIDTGLASIAREETGAFIDVAANGSTRAILDQGKILYNGVKTAVTTEAKEKSSEIAKQYNLRKEMESGTVYQAGENEYYYVSPAGKTMKIEDINKYKADETVSVKGVSSAAGSTASTVTSNANTMGGALSAHQTEKTEEVGYFDKEYEDIISSINNDSPDSTTQYGTGVVNSDTDSIFNVGNHDVTDMLGRESASNKPSMPDPGVIMFGGTSSGIESVGKMAGKITASDAFKRRTDENL